MYIYNVTFVVEKRDCEAFLQWMRGEALSALVNDGSPAREPRLTTVVHVPGAPDFSAHAASFAFQVEFNTLEDAEKWDAVYLLPVLGQYTSRFGADKAQSFATVLQTVDL